MIRIGSVPLALFGWIVSVSSVMLLPSAAQAACSQWDLPGSWIAMQSNGSKPSLPCSKRRPYSREQRATIIPTKINASSCVW